MAYVYAADQGLQLQNETVESIMYDDAAMLLLVIKGGVVFAYDVAQDVPTQHEQLVWTYPLQDGPPVISARCSLDRQMLAMQRSRLLVELVDLPSGNISVMQSDKGRSELLGLFFSEWPDAQVTLLSRAGLEFCTLAARRQGLHSRDTLRLPVHWFQYSHETRCCLVATGPPLGAPYMQAWQFLASGLITLPPFTLASPALGTAPPPPPPPPPPSQPAAAAAAATSPAAAAAAPGNAGGGGGTAAVSRASSSPQVPQHVLPISTHASGGDDAPPSSTAPAADVSTTSANAGNARAAATDAPPPAPTAPPRNGGGPQAAAAGRGGGGGGGGGGVASKFASWIAGGAGASVVGGGGVAVSVDVVPGGTAQLLGGGGVAGMAGAAGAAALLQASWPHVTAGAASEAIVPPSAVRLVKLYGRVYCAHVNWPARRLDLHRLFTDTVVLQHSYPLPSSSLPSHGEGKPSSGLGGGGARVQLAAVDNVLVLLQPQRSEALLVDVCADALSPLGAPRALGHLAPLRRPRQLDQERLQQQLARQARAAAAMGAGGVLGGGGARGGVAALPPPVAWSVVDEEGHLQGPQGVAQWQVHLPNLVVDLKAQVVYRLLLDLGAVVRDHAPRAPAAVAALLQRRRAPRLHVLPLEALAPPTAPTEPQPPTPPSRRAAAAQSASMLQLLRLDSNAASATAAAGGNPPATPTAAAAAGPSSSSLPKAASLSTASQMELSLSSFNLNASTSPSVGRLASPSGQDLAAQGAGGGPGMPTAAAAAGGGGGSASSGQGWSPLPVMLSGVVAPNAIVSKLMLVQLLQGLVAEGAGMPALRQVFDAVARAYGEVASTAMVSQRAAAVAAACVVTPAEVLEHVLPSCLSAPPAPASAAASGGAAEGDAAAAGLAARQLVYAQAAAAELAAAVAAAGLPPLPSLQLYTLQLIAAQQLQRQQHQPQDVGGRLSGADAAAAEEEDQEAVLARALHSASAAPCGGAGGAAGPLEPAGGAAGALGGGAPPLLPPFVAEEVRALGGGAAAAAATAAALRARAAVAQAGGGAAAAAAGGGTWSPAGGGPAAAAAGEAGAALVRSLLREGRFSKAARVARDLRLASVPPQELVDAVAGGEGAAKEGAEGRAALLGALYRTFRTALMPLYPTLDALLQAPRPGAAAV